MHIFSLNRIKTSELLKDTVDFMIDKFNQSKKVFSVASPYGQTIFVMENLAQMMFYYIEDSITELSIREATRDTSVYGLASLAGYKPARAISASGHISISPKNSITEEIIGNVVHIPNYTKLKCTNNDITYMLELTQDEIKIDVTNTSPVNINITQGYIDTQVVKGYGTPYASYAINFPKNYHIDNRLVKVYVNNVLQPLYESILRIPAGEAGCMVRSGITSGIDVFFGNGNFGTYPALGAEIRVEMLITDGYVGRINTDQPENIMWEFSEDGFDAVGNEINLNEVFDVETIIVPSFGSNPEPIELTRMMISKSNGILVSEPDYELMFKRMQSFSIIRVNRDIHNDRIFNVFLVPDVNKLITDNMDYFSIPMDKFKLSDAKKSEIMKYVYKMGTGIISTDMRLIDPVISKYVLNIALVVFDDIDIKTIRRDVISTISNYFLNINRKDRIPRSDIIRIIENVDGVDSVNVRIISEKNEMSKKKNINASDVGIDDMNDIMIHNDELAVIRGGWSDRYGNYYSTTYNNDESLGAINIIIKKINSR